MRDQSLLVPSREIRESVYRVRQLACDVPRERHDRRRREPIEHLNRSESPGSLPRFLQPVGVDRGVECRLIRLRDFGNTIRQYKSNRHGTPLALCAIGGTSSMLTTLLPWRIFFQSLRQRPARCFVLSSKDSDKTQNMSRIQSLYSIEKRISF